MRVLEGSRTKGMSRDKRKVFFLICSVAVILYFTILTRDIGAKRIFKGAFWELQNGMWHDIALNILLFVPFGFACGSIFGRRSVLIGLAFSILIETAQYIGALGYTEVDDVINNTIGTWIGFLIWNKNKQEKLWMVLRNWDELPEFMKTAEVRPYWEILNKKRCQLVLKRIFDFVVALILFIFLAIPMAVIAVMIKLDSKGPVLYRQERVTSYGKHFRIHKFRTMVSNADKIGTAVTVGHDSRITRVGAKLRGLRLDELPQLFDVLSGDMSFVGTRPEAVKYVEKYRDEYYATLLMPAGITSEASIRYKDEDRLLSAADDVDRVYVEEVLPEKMKWNLESVRRFRFLREILTMFRTVLAVCGKDYDESVDEPDKSARVEEPDAAPAKEYETVKK